MIIDIPNENIEQMVKDQVDKSVRQRIKEMQGNYTSKGYLEDIIRDVIWDKIIKLCPNVEDYITSEVQRCANYVIDMSKDKKVTKKQLVELIVDKLLEEL